MEILKKYLIFDPREKVIYIVWTAQNNLNIIITDIWSLFLDARQNVAKETRGDCVDLSFCYQHQFRHQCTMERKLDLLGVFSGTNCNCQINFNCYIFVKVHYPHKG